MKQLKCPSCGATLNQSFPNQLIVECPYCHQQVVNETFQSSGKDNEPRVLEFKMTENEVRSQIVDLFVGDKNVPTDIFDKMKIISIEKYYVPMYIFEGTFRAPWRAERPRREKRQRIGSDGKIENYEETLYDYFNGEATGNFSVNGISSNEMSILDLNAESIQKIVVNPYQLSFFSEIQVNSNNNIKILTPSKDSNSVWWESGESTTQDIGVCSARHQAQGYLKDCSVSIELKKTSFVYLPFWKMEYEYNNNMFNSIYYAEQFIDYNHPIGEEIKVLPTVDQKDILEKYNNNNDILKVIRDLGCAGFAAVGLIGCVFIHQSLDKLHRYDPYYREHYNDDFNFLKYMFFAGIVLLIIIPILKKIFRQKYKIDDIEADIANRTWTLQREANSYKRRTGEVFLKQFSGCSSIPSATQEMNNYSYDVKKEDLAENHNISPLYTAASKSKKFCSNCGKEINGTHKFCRYCGAKI